MSRERRLGRGLEALLGRSLEQESDEVEVFAEEAPLTNAPSDPADRAGFEVEVGLIDRNPYQPRENFKDEEIADLCDSLRTHGFLQPIVVRRVAERYQLVAGERRLRAAQLGGFERIPAQVREVDDRQMAELAIVENIQRKDLNAIEKGASFQRYLDEYGCTQEELAKRVSIDRSTVANLIRLLELPANVKQMVADSEISAGHARALLPLGDPEEQIRFATTIRDESLSVRATERAVQDRIRNLDEPLSIVDADGNSRPSPIQPGQHLRDLEEQLRLALGTKVDLRQTAKGKGRMTIHFGSHEEFDRLRTLITGQSSIQSEVS